MNKPKKKVFICVDHDTHYPIGGASIIVAANKGSARRMLNSALIQNNLKDSLGCSYTLEEIDLTKPAAYILCDGGY